MSGYTISPERTERRPNPDYSPPPAVGSKPQPAELDELYAAVRTIRAFCRGREHCIQDFGKDRCPIYRCCGLLPIDWPDEVDNERNSGVTHWMLLPEPPKEVSGK